MLLVLTNKVDPHADHLIAKVAGRFPVLRINTDNFVEEYEVTMRISGDGRLDGLIRDRHGHGFDLSGTAVGWYRRPAFDEMQVDADPEFAELVRSEARFFVDALCALPGIRWINQPAAVVAARSKPAQLLLARQLGFSVPDTIITNRPDEAVDFARRMERGTIVKSIYSASVSFDDVPFSCMTKRVDHATLEENRESIAICPTQLQEEIAKQFEIRVTVVGDEVFACRIDSQHDASTEVDWRVDPDVCRYAPLDLPEWVESGCRELVRSSGLDFGAVDLIHADDGRYVFLENNPTGQYLWLEQATGLDITGAMIGLFERRMREMAAR